MSTTVQKVWWITFVCNQGDGINKEAILVIDPRERSTIQDWSLTCDHYKNRLLVVLTDYLRQNHPPIR